MQMSDRKLRVGIIGIGWWALTRHAPRLQETGKAEIVAIARRNAQALADAKEILGVESAYTDWRMLLDKSNLDAVIVSTPHHVHVEPTLAALERGLHVLVEKPMTLTSQDAWAMVEAAERTKRVLMVGYDRRCAGCWRAAAQALEDGILGTIRQVNLSICYNYYWMWQAKRMPPPMQEMLNTQGVPKSFFDDSLEGFWRRDPQQMGGGTFADSGSHFVDLGLWLGGAPPVEVVALTESAGLPVDSHVSLQARLANDVLFSFSSADGVPAGINRLTIYGDLGTLTADWVGEEVSDVVVHSVQGRETLGGDVPDTTPTAAFIDTVVEGSLNLSPALDGAYAVALTEAAYHSASEKRVVAVDLPQTL
jgi:predicted dehydrogenase